MHLLVDMLNLGLLDARKSTEKGTRSLTEKIKGIFNWQRHPDGMMQVQDPRNEGKNPLPY
jgi:hypothetical protein